MKKKTGGGKSRWTVPLKETSYLYIFGQVEGIGGPPKVGGHSGLQVPDVGRLRGRRRQLENPAHLLALQLHRRLHRPEGELHT